MDTQQRRRRVYVGLCLGGLEQLVRIDVLEQLADYAACIEVAVLKKNKVDSGVAVSLGDAGVGKLLITTYGVPVACITELQGLQGLYAFLSWAENLEICGKGRDAAADLQQIVDTIPDSLDDWRGPVDIWREASGHCASEPLSFRVTGCRDGIHSFSSVAVASAVGAKVATVNGWKVDLTNFDCNISVIVLDTTVLSGICIRKRFTTGIPSEARDNLPALDRIISLRPSTARAMLRLLLPLPMEGCQEALILMDPMSGLGTIPIEAALTSWGCSNAAVFGLGGELSDKICSQAAQNFSSARHVTHCGASDGCRWDARRLPLRDCCVDGIAVDLPFGVRIKHKNIAQLYFTVLNEICRVLRVKGRAVLLSTKIRYILKYLERNVQLQAALTVLQTHEVNIGGLLGSILVLEKCSHV
jgi:tRNA G10  N-methylase Trm11